MRPRLPASAARDAATRLAARSAALSISAATASSWRGETPAPSWWLSRPRASSDRCTVHGVEAAELLAHRLDVSGELADVRVDLVQAFAVGAERHLRQRAVETPLELVEAPVQRRQRTRGIVVRQHALQQRGNVGKARLEPGRIVRRKPMCRLHLGVLGPVPVSGRATLLSGAGELGVRRLVGAHQLFRRLRIPRIGRLGGRVGRRRGVAPRPARKRRCARSGSRSPPRCGPAPARAARATRRVPGRAAGRPGRAAPARRRSPRGCARFPAACCSRRRRTCRFPGGRRQRGNALPARVWRPAVPMG